MSDDGVEKLDVEELLGTGTRHEWVDGENQRKRSTYSLQDARESSTRRRQHGIAPVAVVAARIGVVLAASRSEASDPDEGRGASRDGRRHV
jgi:hypothetical protein